MYTTRFTRRSWVEIDCVQLETNLKIAKSHMSDNTDIMAVIKADAYGHGDTKVATLLNKLGVTLFAVSNIDEAILLRECGIKGEILIIGYTPVELASELMKYDITQTLVSEEYAEKLLTGKMDIKCQFAIDTGMGRIGINACDIDRCVRAINKYADRCKLNGIFTHLSVADSADESDILFTKKQIDMFENLAKCVSHLELEYIHCLNSAGGLYHSCCTHNKVVRLGIVLYGLKPDYYNTLPEGISPVLTWKTVISALKTVDANKSIGYGRTFITSKPMKIATLPTGYADGYNRALSNKGFVLINGQKAPIVGRICMDQMMVDVTEIDHVKEGDEVVLLNDKFGADDMARLIGTIGYEVVCNISKRVPRIYIE